MSTATKTKAETPPAWQRRTDPLTDKMRADRAAKYPNPQTVNIDALIAAAKAEADTGARGSSEALSYLYGVHTENAAGRRCSLIAEHSQWDSESKTYTQWVRNPRLGDVTEVPLAEVFRQFRQWIRDYRSARVVVDNICGALGITYAAMTPTFTVTVTATVGEEEMRRAGYDINNVPTEADNATTREYVSMGLQNWLGRNSRSDAITYTINMPATRPTA